MLEEINMNIKPIKDLRNTIQISKEAHEKDEPIFITKNGYSDLVVLSHKAYNKLTNNQYNPVKTMHKEITINNQSDNNGYINISCTPINCKISDVSYNAKQIIQKVKDKVNENINILVFPELSLTGYTCGDLFLTKTLKNACIKYINYILNETKNDDIYAW